MQVMHCHECTRIGHCLALWHLKNRNASELRYFIYSFCFDRQRINCDGNPHGLLWHYSALLVPHLKMTCLAQVTHIAMALTQFQLRKCARRKKAVHMGYHGIVELAMKMIILCKHWS